MFSELIELVCIKRKLNKTQLSNLMGITAPTLSGRLKRDNFREKDMEEIAKLLNCTLEIHLKLNDTGEEF